MTTIIRDENGNEDILQGSANFLPPRKFTISVILLLILIFWRSGVLAGIFFLVVCVFIGFFIIIGEKITLDTRIKSVIVEYRWIANKKLEIEWEEAKKIKFSDIQRINVIEQYNYSDNGSYYSYHTDLIIADGEKKTILWYNNSDLWNNYSESAKNSAIKICKIIGVNAYFIDEKKNSSMLWVTNMKI